MCHSKKKDTSKRLVYDAVWFKEEILNKFAITITPDDVGYEAVLLEHDEIDENIISKEELELLPNPLLAQTFVYTHSNEDVWLLIIVIHEQDGSMLHQTWLKNNQKINPTGGGDMKVIQTLADVQALERDEHLPSFYIEEIKKQFLLWYEAENEGEEIQDFSLPSYTCIYHFNHANDGRMLESYVNDIEYVDTERMGGVKYFRIGIMQDHQMSIIYFLEGTLPYRTEKWLEH